MPVAKIWVLAESFEGKALSSTLEMLTKARELGSTVEAFTWGADTDAVAGELGAHGATKVFTTGDLGGALPGVPVAAAIAAQAEADGAPDALLVAQSYDGRDVAGRLSAKLDTPVLTNAVGLSAEGDKLVSEHAVFGGTTMVKAEFVGASPQIFLIRPKSFAAEPSGGAAPEVATVAVPDAGATNAAKIIERHVEERTGPKLDEAAVVVSGGRGLG
ncbi:MAG: electron transfer flavoprotein alpha subunit, partial [Actinomycetota bacterium]|nr:electron transfer flavoprotein alpha subunit [Actinomycetota bacterium]